MNRNNSRYKQWVSIAFIIALASLFCLNGCATLFTSEHQSLKIETISKEGKPIKDCQCKITNDRGDWKVSTPDPIMVHRSAKDLEIVCEKPGYKPTLIKSKSHPSPAMLANAILPGGTIGAIIDHKKGTAYQYPSVLRIIMEPKRPA